MKKFTKEMVDHYADKVWIGLTKEENKMVLDEFAKIDADIDQINKIPGLEKREPMTHCLDFYLYELREDKTEDAIEIEKLFQNCDDYEDREIRVPRVVKK